MVTACLWTSRIVLLALEEDASAFRFAASELHADRDVMLLAVRRNGLALQFAVDEFRDNEEILGGVTILLKFLNFPNKKTNHEEKYILTNNALFHFNPCAPMFRPE